MKKKLLRILGDKWKIKQDSTEFFNLYYNDYFVIELGTFLPPELQIKMAKLLVKNITKWS